MIKQNKIILSIIIPMYNGEIFIDNSLHSILNQKILDEKITDFFEIIIVNDGSKDNGSNKAKQWAKKWNKEIRKNFIRVIDKENGQYGSVINRALEEVTGKYIKVLDVDDIFISENFIQVIQILLGFKIDIDVVITDFIFDKVAKNKQIIYEWTKYFEPFKILETSKQKYPTSIITMHAIIYRTQFLKDINYHQVEGIYYSDSQYATVPLVQAKLLYYINIPLYRYYIGRGEQSINIKSMVKHRLDQRKITKVLIDELFNIEMNSNNQKKYAWRIAKNMFEWQSMIICHDKSVKNKNKLIYDDLVNLIKKCKEENNNVAYKTVKNGALAKAIRITKGKGIVPLIIFGEKLYAKFKLNVMADWE